MGSADTLPFFMTTIPAEVVALCCGLASLAWLFYARSQHGRRNAAALGWLGLPFLVTAGIYLWFSFAPVEIELRMMHARMSLFTISLSQAIILTVVSYLQKRGPHERNK